MPVELPDVHYGSADNEGKAAIRPDPHEDDDDELLAETPADVIAMLGFDPLEFETGEDAVDEELPKAEYIDGRVDPDPDFEPADDRRGDKRPPKPEPIVLRLGTSDHPDKAYAAALDAMGAKLTQAETERHNQKPAVLTYKTSDGHTIYVANRGAGADWASNLPTDGASFGSAADSLTDTWDKRTTPPDITVDETEDEEAAVDIAADELPSKVVALLRKFKLFH